MQNTEKIILWGVKVSPYVQKAMAPSIMKNNVILREIQQSDKEAFILAMQQSQSLFL